MNDSGVYTVKVHSASSVEVKTFDLKVGPQLGANPGIVVVRGKLPKKVEDEDADFRGKLKKIHKPLNKARIKRFLNIVGNTNLVSILTRRLSGFEILNNAT